MDAVKYAPRQVLDRLNAAVCEQYRDERAGFVRARQVNAVRWLDDQLEDMGMPAAERVTCARCGAWWGECVHG